MESLPKCTKCQIEINDTDRAPVLISCLHLICIKCAQKEDPQQQEIFCDGCDSAVKLDRSNLNVNKLALESFKNQLKKVDHKFICAKHQSKEIEFFCAQDKCLFCSLCVMDHTKHIDNMSLYTSKDITEKAKKLK